MRKPLLLAALLAGACTTSASADVVISKAATQNMNCSNGVCVPTSRDSVLNVGDLETMLSSGDLAIDAGLGGGANPIVVKAPFQWSASTTLTMMKSKLVAEARITVAGNGNLVLARLSIKSGAIRLANLSSRLSIRNVNYQLVGTLAGMASAIAANPGGNFALAQSYNASGDGTYTHSPVKTAFGGTFLGLGNTISNISVNNTKACCVAGLFQELLNANIYDVRLRNVNIVSTGSAAGLAYENYGTIWNSSVTGSVAGGATGDIGGLISDNYGVIYYSYSTAAVSAPSSVTNVNMGGLVGVGPGTMKFSFATGSVSAGNGTGVIGGLAGLISHGAAQLCYGTGPVTGGNGLTIGGLIGKNTDSSYIEACYSTGAVSGGSGSIAGGFAGENDSSNVLYDNWDTTTSGTDVGVGSGSTANITGLTSKQLQSGLPDGFDPAYWAEKSTINSGFPYLIKNPPPK